MLEIFILISLCKHIGEKAKAKGQSGCGMQILTVVLWFGGEVLGGILGIVATGGEGGLLIYVFAIGGAIVGAVLANVIVAALPDNNAPNSNLGQGGQDTSWYPPPARPRRVSQDDNQQATRRPTWDDQRSAPPPQDQGWNQNPNPQDPQPAAAPLEAWEERILMSKAATRASQGDEQEAIRLYQEVIDRSTNPVTVGQAREKIDEIRERQGGKERSW